MELQEGLPHGLTDMAAHQVFVAKFHLAFGRVDVDIHDRRIEFQKQTANGIASFHQRGVIALEQRVVQAPVFDRPAVHEQMLILPISARHAGGADESPNAQAGGPTG